MTTRLETVLAEQVERMQREADAVRKLMEATRELGEERVRALLGPVLNLTGGNGSGHGVVALFPAPAPAPVAEIPPDEPRGREAVRLIVHERPGLWTLAELRAEMQGRGWFTSNKGVDVAVTRLCASKEARRVGKGRYEFFAPVTEEREAL